MFKLLRAFSSSTTTLAYGDLIFSILCRQGLRFEVLRRQKGTLLRSDDANCWIEAI